MNHLKPMNNEIESLGVFLLEKGYISQQHCSGNHLINTTIKLNKKNLEQYKCCSVRQNCEIKGFLSSSSDN